MVVDGGIAGLEQSRHHPLAGQGAINPPTPRITGEEEGSKEGGDDTGVIELFKDLVIPGKEEEFVRRLREALAKTRRRGGAPTTNIDGEIKKIHTKIEELAKALQRPTGTTGKASWAAVVAGTTQVDRSRNEAFTPKVVIPERRTREVVIRAPEQGEDLAQRTAVQVVEAVNRAMGSDGAVAARRMRSGDTVLTFKGNAEGYTKNTTWVETAFGVRAEVKRREFAVIAKGLPASRLRGIQNPERLLIELQKHTPMISRCRTQLPKFPSGLFASVVLHMSSVAAAQEVCRKGVIYEAQIFDVEPYYPEANVRRCFRCHSFGHIGRYCERQQRCGHCAAAAHPEGEAGCPEKAPSGKKRCVNCQGAHTAWERSCPVAKKEFERAQRAYRNRPLQFETTQGSRYDETAPTQNQIDTEGYQVVGSKRIRTRSRQPAPRGRPSGLTQAARTCRGIEAYASRDSSVALARTQNTVDKTDPFE
jgi:hypothetical protein